MVVREGALPAGAEEAVDEAGGRVLLAGSGTGPAAEALAGAAAEIRCWEAGEFAPARWAGALASPLGEDDVVVLPASADGRDLAPRLAQAMGRPLHAPAVRVGRHGATLVRSGGLALLDVDFDGPCVATLQPGSRGTDPRGDAEADRRTLDLRAGPAHDAGFVGLVAADPATVDLREASRIMAGGAGVGSPEAMALLGRVATALGCATGATRVVADAGWIGMERQIGTTGEVVDPDLYIAVGISGAVQHLSGIGSPRHVVAVNLDPSCPMMAMADLALVTDAPAFVRALAERLGIGAPEPEAGVGAGGGTR